jgi:hypothetical protein
VKAINAVCPEWRDCKFASHDGSDSGFEGLGRALRGKIVP